MDEHISSYKADMQSLQASFHVEYQLSITGGDPAFTNRFGVEALATLQTEGYAFQPLSTGQKGGEIEVLILFSQTLAFLKEHHTALSEATQDFSALVGIFTSLLPIYQGIYRALKKHEGSNDTDAPLVKITTKIDGHSLTIEAKDLAQAEAALHLAQRFHSQHPHISQQTASSKDTIKTHVHVTKPAKKKPGRRRAH